MGFLKSIFGTKQVVVDPADLQIPNEVQTDVKGLTLKKAPGEVRHDVSIVGENYRKENVAAVAAAAGDKWFEFYLVAEPNNQYDKKAVAVYAAGLHVGYISRNMNAMWFKMVNDALKRKELLWGQGKATFRPSSNDFGIHGHVLLPKMPGTWEALEPKQLTDAALAKAIDKVLALSAKGDEPDTLGQLRSLSKKCVTAATPIAANAMWFLKEMEETDAEVDDKVVDLWTDVLSFCEEIFDDAETATYAEDPYEVDVVGTLGELAEKVEKIKALKG